MPELGSLHSFANETDVVDADLFNDNFGALRTWADESVLELDVAKTVSVEHTWTGRQIFPRMAVRGVVGTILAVPTSTQTAIPFDGVEDFDSHSFHDSSSNPSRFTIPAGMGGLYLPFLHIETPVAATTRVLHKVLLNGLSTGEAAKAQPGYHHETGSFVFGCTFPPLVLAAADYIQFTVYQESGSSANIAAGGFNCAGLILLSK